MAKHYYTEEKIVKTMCDSQEFCTINVIEDKCVGCYKCINACPTPYANISYKTDSGYKVNIDHNRCISCGACIKVCDHDAREYYDDTERFFKDLEKGENITLIVAPSAKFSCIQLTSFFGFLRQNGINSIFDVSVGADIAVWAYLKYIEDRKLFSGISQPCPCIVNYIERYLPLLVQYLIPVQSPAICTAIYLKKYCNNTDKIAFFSPCIAKLTEIKDDKTFENISYNVTYKEVEKYLKNNNVNLSKYRASYYDNDKVGLGAIISRPGGLRENINHYRPDVYIKQIEGTTNAYEYLKSFNKRLSENLKFPVIVDALNCTNGCNYGTASCESQYTDEIDFKMNILKADLVADMKLEGKKAEEVFEEFSKRLCFDDFIRGYENKSNLVAIKEPTEEQYEDIYKCLYKFDDLSRNINCLSCGFETCKAFAKAVHNDISQIDNCAYYNKKIVELEKEEIKLINKSLELANTHKDRFLSTMSHELRTPLNAILGFTQLLDNQYYGNLNIKQLEYLGLISNSGGHLLDLINDILDISKIDAGRMEMVYEDVEVKEEIKVVVSIMNSQYKEKNINLKILLEENAGLISIDKRKFRQILLNLLSNALKFTDENGEVKIISEKNNNYLKISVKDNGVGILPEMKDKVFEEFVQLESTYKNALGGTGIGLALTKRLVMLHGGSIGVESEAGNGSTFWFTVPMSDNS